MRNTLLLLINSLLLTGCFDDSELSTPLLGNEGIDCHSLAHWSPAYDGIKINQQHLFCGDINRKGKLVGFHAMPENKPPTHHRSSHIADSANTAGIYTLRDIRLTFDNKPYQKNFSSMFPAHCSRLQINRSIIYSIQNSHGECTSPSWASCGPNAPKNAHQQANNPFCSGNDGRSYPIASAAIRSDDNRINTAFPLYR